MESNTNRKPVRGTRAAMFCAVSGTLLFLGSTQSAAQKPGASSAPEATLVIPPLSSSAPPANPAPKPTTTGSEKGKKPAMKPSSAPSPSSPPSAKQKPAASGTTTRYINLND